MEIMKLAAVCWRAGWLSRRSVPKSFHRLRVAACDSVRDMRWLSAGVVVGVGGGTLSRGWKRKRELRKTFRMCKTRRPGVPCESPVGRDLHLPRHATCTFRTFTPATRETTVAKASLLGTRVPAL